MSSARTLASAPREPLPRAYYVALLSILLFALGLTLILPVLPLFVTDAIGAPAYWVGTATLFVTLTAVASRIPSGTLSDKQGRRKLMLIGAVVGVVANVLYAFTHTLAPFLVGRLLSGMSIGFFTTANKALIADLAPPSRRGEALGMSNAAFSIAMIASPLIGEGLKNALGFQAVFLAGALLSALAALVTYTLPRNRPQHQPEGNMGHSVQLILRMRGAWASILLMVGLGVGFTVTITYFPLLAERKAVFADAPAWLAPVAIGLGLSVWALVDTLIEPVAGRLSDRIGRQAVAVPGLALLMGGLWAVGQVRHTYGAYSALALLAVGWGTVRTIGDAIAQDSVPPALRGMIAAVIYTAFDMSIGVNAQLLGGLIQGDDFGAFFRAALGISFAACLVGIALATRLQPHPSANLVGAPTQSSD